MIRPTTSHELSTRRRQGLKRSGLLVLTLTLLASGYGWWLHWHSAEYIAARLRSYGARVRMTDVPQSDFVNTLNRILPARPPTLANLGGTTVQVGGGDRIRPRQAVWVVELKGPQVSNDTMRLLADCEYLHFVRLTDTLVDDDGLRYLKDCRRLVSFEVRGGRFTGEALSWLAGLPLLETVEFSDCPVTDDALPHLARLPALRILRLNRTHVTRSGLEFISRLKQLDISPALATRDPSPPAAK
jgi:hypothetical protein